MHRFKICLVVVLSLACSGVKTPLDLYIQRNPLTGEGVRGSGFGTHLGAG